MKTKSDKFYLFIAVFSLIVLVSTGVYAYYQTSYSAKMNGST